MSKSTIKRVPWEAVVEFDFANDEAPLVGEFAYTKGTNDFYSQLHCLGRDGVAVCDCAITRPSSMRYRHANHFVKEAFDIFCPQSKEYLRSLVTQLMAKRKSPQ